MVNFDEDGFFIRQKIKKKVRLNVTDKITYPILEKKEGNKSDKLKK
ncbi:hypothetical protein LCGC14_2391020 [marine sediment metagenome]|uniref:Uncharacterized protein n=1 Tax=marine sediment metagenome TaxID=412755 RepID=A0A0F9CK90_9ZZZZ